MTKIAQITAKIGGGVALALVSFVNLAPADAATFTFNAGDDNLPTITKTVDGITLTASNPSTGVFTTDSDGLCVLGNTGFCQNITSFNLTFSKSVQLNSYQIGFVSSNNNGQLTLTAGAFNTTEASPFVDEQNRNFANMITVQANQVISVVGTISTQGWSSLQWRQITVNEVMSPPVTTPEPTMMLGLLGVGALGFVTRKKK
ncbi:MAG: PEP-CTERM sorting domain-containing protein [Cyanobacterium sp. T60_A2020_053]|nr:PEP-CTERM sorting domain-containing protein [Cyanobacterium sp. T60_A2020_053]